MKEKITKIQNWISKNRKIVWFAVLVAFICGIWASWSGQNYSASVSVLVSRVASAQPIDYNYDSYYALKATDEFGGTVVGWLKTPEVVEAVYKRAQIEFNPSTFSGFSGSFKGIKVSPSTVEIRFECSSPDDAKKIAKALGETISEKNKQLADSSKQGINFVALASDPVVIKNRFDVYVKFSAGLLIGLVFGLFFQRAKEFFRE